MLKELPDRQEALVLQGLLYCEKNDRKNVLSKLKAALDINSTLCEAWIAQAQIFQQVICCLVRTPAIQKLFMPVFLHHCLTGSMHYIFVDILFT